MALPTSRSTTYAALSQVKSADLNGIQDAIIAINNFLTAVAQGTYTDLTLVANKHVTVSGTGAHKRGVRVRKIPIISGQQTSGTAMTLNGANTDTHDAVQTSATNNKYKIPITVEEGERITLVTMRAQTLNAGDTSAMKVFKSDATGGTPTTTQLGTTGTTSAPPSTVTLSSGALTETVGATAITYYVEITCSAFNTGTVFYGLEVTTDIP
jgi:hypothetical protein